jgi:myo-inositol 2-dehydrogenase/D-chiro-inositol 1-dehydrogenase
MIPGPIIPPMNENISPSPDRRDFLKSSTAAVAAGIAFPSVTFGKPTDKKLRLGVVGCGGRGTGAISQALKADSNIELVAMGDAFSEKIDRSLQALERNSGIESVKLKVKDSRKFVGVDSYEKVLDSDVDVVILTTPPGFRPMHLLKAVEAGKHVFTEKPMATDAPGVRLVQKAVEISKKKELAMVAGFCWRYDYARKELFKRIADGEIGEVRAAYGTYLTGVVKPMPAADTRPEGITDLEWMVRNWYNFNWLSGDGYVEQAIHTVDWLAWVMGDKPPASCTAVGGRQIPAEGGNIFDHIEVNYLWDNHVRGTVAQRQMGGCFNENSFYVLGADGEGWIKSGRVYITGKNPWRYSGPKNDMYQTEHDEMFASIREGNVINNGDRMISSTLMGIMGRTAAYTGKEITWEQINNSKQVLAPQDLTRWDDKMTPEPMAMPGRTKFI